MEHYKSTLATAAVAAFGLVAAAHILHPGNYEDLPRHVRAPIVSAEVPASTMAWIDPPARANAASAVSNAVITTAQAAEVAPTQAPQPTVVMVAETVASQPDAQEAHVSVEQLRKSEAPRRHKVAQRRIRVHQASLTSTAPRTPTVKEQVSAPDAPAQTADRFDPIGALIHGLGLDS
ncbi:hypothetical protein MKK75_30460 [Methylobacterium sp. J-030]|uniref:hypothetical protein n=1 Tax=Methylobacterium sp. J-030 TaxID=2836627 RepID=UPI001FBB7FD8|nr:hypothetical protein [Methylobacterium sp. J-030]MCJ2073070.1 hypothetical protein [Methylobacterium sp. J-030]